MVEECGFSVERRRCVELLHYTTEDYLNLVSTYSNRLLLDPPAQAELRSRLARRIGSAGVNAQNDDRCLHTHGGPRDKGALRTLPEEY